MTNTRVYGLTEPRTDTAVAASGEPEAYTAIPATAVATAAPDGDTPFISTQNAETVRSFIRYTGTVTCARLRRWVLQDGAWYRTSDVLMDPAGGNESYDWIMVGRHTNVAFQVVTIEGGGTLEVSVVGVY